MNKLIKLLILSVMLFFLAGVGLAMACYDCDDGCEGVRSPGYWKNHDWLDVAGVDEICFGPGDELCFDQIPSGGADKCDTILRQILAAELNIERDLDCACDGIPYILYRAEKWYNWNCVDDSVRGYDPAWRYKGERLYRKLDAYNNGRFDCAPKED